MVISGANLLHTSLAVKARSDGLVGLHELIELSRELLVLNGDNADVVVQRVDLDLEVRVVVEEGAVAVSGTLELLSHVHDLVLLGTDTGLEVLDGSGEFNVARSLAVDTLLQVTVLIAVLLLEGLQVVELVLEADHLVLQLNDLAFALDKLCLLALEVEGLRVNKLVEIVNARKLLLDIVLQSSRLGRQVG